MRKSNYRYIYFEGDRQRKKGSRNRKRDGKVSIGLTMAYGSDVLWQAGGAGWVLSPAGREHADGADGYNRGGALDPMTPTSTHLFLMLYTAVLSQHPSRSGFGGPWESEGASCAWQGRKAFPSTQGQSSNLPKSLSPLFFRLEHETWSPGGPLIPGVSLP